MRGGHIMRYIKKLLVLIFGLYSFGLFAAQGGLLRNQTIEIEARFVGSRFVGSMWGGALGDALGRVTEFIPSTEQIFNDYPGGVQSFDDFLPRDWAFVPKKFKQQNVAPYTDDTRMAKLVLSVLIEARQKNWDLNQTMEQLAKIFVNDMHDHIYGWAAPFRAPGNTVLRSTKKLERLFQHPEERGRGTDYWWQVGESHAGGCGSVMRAHPFGLVFADNPEKAALWAAEHSKLTHGHPMTLAACAALAIGVAYALQQKDPAWIIDQMIKTARAYHVETAEKMIDARARACEAKKIRARFSTIRRALADKEFRAFHNHVFTTFEGWAAHDAIAATVYIFELCPYDVMEAIYLGVNTPGDSDSIASMAGALVGALVGKEQLPPLIDCLEDAKELQENAEIAAQLQPK